MVERLVPRIRAFYGKYLPIGDRLGEMFYAVWMAVISLGILGTTEVDLGLIAYAVLLAFSVNMTWGLIDGLSVMHTNVIDRARNDKLVYDLMIGDKEEAANTLAVSRHGAKAPRFGVVFEDFAKQLSEEVRLKRTPDPAH